MLCSYVSYLSLYSLPTWVTLISFSFPSLSTLSTVASIHSEVLGTNLYSSSSISLNLIRLLGWLNGAYGGEFWWCVFLYFYIIYFVIGIHFCYCCFLKLLTGKVDWFEMGGFCCYALFLNAGGNILGCAAWTVFGLFCSVTTFFTGFYSSDELPEDSISSASMIFFLCS